MSDELDLNFIDKSDFVALVNTPLQKVSAVAILLGMNLDDGKVIVTKHHTTGFPNNAVLIEGIKFDYIFWDEKYDEFEDKGHGKHIVNPDGKPLYFLTAYFKTDIYNKISRLYPNRKVIYIIIDSGLGSYDKQRSENFKTMIESDFIIDARMYKERNGKIVGRNKPFSDYYLDFYRYTRIDLINYYNLVLKNSILINSQPLEEDGLLDNKTDYEFYKKIARFGKERNIKVVLKPHPRENNLEKYEKLGITILRCSCMQETLFSQCEKPLCLISPFSTTMINATLLFDIPSIGLTKMIKCPSIQNVLNDFVENYNDFIFFPATEKELFQKVLSLRSNN